MAKNEDEVVEVGAFPIAVEDVYLVSCRFSDTAAAEWSSSRPINEPDFTINYAMHRLSERQLDIAMICEVRTPGDRPSALEVMYAGQFVMKSNYPSDQRERAWAQFASEIAPVVLYPYVREFVSELSGRGKSSAVLLPILLVGSALPPDDFSIPPPPESAGD